MLDNSDINNRIMSTILSGSKGSLTNLGQIMSNLGQQIIEGKRVQNFYLGRPIPHVVKDSLTAENRGYISNGFAHGLTPLEYIYHAMAGRVGVISTSIKTAETGYIQRRLMKVMEDLRAMYDSTVRNANLRITQFVYGGDGMDGAMIEEQRILYMTMPADRMWEEYAWSTVALSNMEGFLTPRALAQFRDEENHREILQVEWEHLVRDKTRLFQRLYRHGIPTLYSPINFVRLLKSYQDRQHLNDRQLADVDPIYVIRRVEDLLKRLRITSDPEIQKYSTFIFHTMVRSYLSSRKMIEMHMDQSSFDMLIEEIEYRFYRSMVNPGELVGPISAQSIGEPATQMTLDTFHHTGVAEKSRVSSQGVPRLKEILSITSRQKTPSCAVHLLPEETLVQMSEFVTTPEPGVDQEEFWKSKSEELKSFKNFYLTLIKTYMPTIEYTTFADLIEPPVQIFFDQSRDSESIMTQDREILQRYWTLLDEEEPQFEGARWVMRFKLSREARFLRGQIGDISNIFHQLRSYLPENAIVVVSPERDGSEEMFVRIRIPNGTSTDAFVELKSAILKTHFGGVEGITRVYERESIRDVMHNDHIRSRFDILDRDPDAKRKIEYVLDTKGTNLLEILALPQVDTYQTASNNIHEIYELFGIEAARSALLKETIDVIESAGASLAPRHIGLLCDIMTFKGILVSVDRHGMSKGDSGPLARASFEETVNQLTNAAFFGEEDNMAGVSSNIMFGQTVPAGTNAFDIILDEEMLQQIPVPLVNLPREDTVVSIGDLKGSETEFCENKLQFGFEF